MKATLAMLACLSMVGFLTAAEVTGNNTAVVIQKTAVRANNWQFICVPVNKLDITGSEDASATVSVDELLPPALYSVNTEVYTVGENGASTYACGLATDGTTKTWSGSTTEFLPGTILWVKGDTDSASTVFCGQDRGTREAPDLSGKASGSLTPMKNDSSVAITLAEAVKAGTTKAGDEIYVLEAGKTEYKRYIYGVPFGTTGGARWFDPAVSTNAVTDAVIAAGEAFFYYTR